MSLILERQELPNPGELPKTDLALVQVETDSELLSGVQTFPVSFTKGDGSRPDEALITCNAFLDGPHTPMQSVRNRLYAHATGLDVYSVGTPGMAIGELGYHGADLIDSYGLSEQQQEQLAKGLFTSLGRNTWEALMQYVRQEDIGLAGKRLHALNYSMANSVFAGILDAAPAELADGSIGIGRIVNAESPSLHPRPEGRLLLDFTSGKEQKKNKEYEAANPEWVPRTTDIGSLVKLIAGISRRMKDHKVLGVGMAAGLANKQFMDGLRDLEVPADEIDVMYVAAEAGAVSGVEWNRRAAEELAQKSGSDLVRTEIWPGQRHGFCNDLGVYIFSVAGLFR